MQQIEHSCKTVDINLTVATIEELWFVAIADSCGINITSSAAFIMQNIWQPAEKFLNT